MLIKTKCSTSFGITDPLVSEYANGSSLVQVNSTASLNGQLEVNLDNNAPDGSYTILSASGITGQFESVSFTGRTPNYSLSYYPTNVVLTINSVDIPATLNGEPIKNLAVVCCGRPVLLGPLPTSGDGPTTYSITHTTGQVRCRLGTVASQTYLKMFGRNGSCTVVGTKNGIVSNPLTIIAP